MKFEYEAPVPPIRSPEAPEAETPDTPDVSKSVNTGNVECPTRAQELKEPVGHIKGDLKVTGYELVGKFGRSFLSVDSSGAGLAGGSG